MTDQWQVISITMVVAAQAWELTGTAITVDADTIDVDQARVRLFGIDAPELGQICRRSDGRNWRCGVVARDRLADLVDGQVIRCIGNAKDDYGRLLGICSVEGVDVNALLITEGLAWAFVKYASDYVALQTNALQAKVGIWQGEAQPPWEYREARWVVGQQSAPNGCPIKGNINRDGEHIYHAPWSPWYDRTKVDVTRGERWFCDEKEAISAGWRAPRWTR